ncbi:helix-turn-helix domain-containing protein [Pseudonocardia sp. H11422]|uniref:helix-turn-helix domain-containing protein n=1 Tax=Pseudonocardia sp. H11422 TaxID=2835866 RepID=UPI001BDD8079|nr:helix-turn-helix transcriptional regulator [Pseudonocardia sp. H11422]
MVAVQGPAGPRRRLGAELRRLRNKAGLHLDDVAEQLTCSTSKISRLETGKGIPKLPDVRELMRIYGVTSDTERDMLIRLVRDSREQGWWEPYTEGVPPERFVLDAPGRYAALETEATAVRCFTAMVLPGLLQTQDYAREMMTAILPHHRPSEIERLVDLRMQRQQALHRADSPLELSVVLDEALLRRVVGGREMMADQLRSIDALLDLPTVDVRVLSFEAGFHRALLGQFTILELRESLADIVYVEGHAGDSYLDNEPDVTLYKEVYVDVARRALDPGASRELITEYLRAHTARKGDR